MTLRYLISFADSTMRPEQLLAIRNAISDAADAREWRDIVIANGGTIKDLRRDTPTPAFVRRARARAR